MDGGAWWAAVHGVAKSWRRLSDFTFIFHLHALEKEMATHSSVLGPAPLRLRRGSRHAPTSAGCAARPAPRCPAEACAGCTPAAESACESAPPDRWPLRLGCSWGPARGAEEERGMGEGDLYVSGLVCIY